MNVGHSTRPNTVMETKSRIEGPVDAPSHKDFQAYIQKEH